MNEHDRLLHAAIEEPDDDAPRLVYADWLTDNGDPERADFIRAQCRLATLFRMFHLNGWSLARLWLS